MNIIISPEKVFTVLLVAISFLVVGNILGVITVHFFSSKDKFIVFHIFNLIFNLDSEKSISTLYSIFTLLASSFILLTIVIKHKSMKSNYLYWLILMLIFLFLSLDEFIGIHERLTDITGKLLNTSKVIGTAAAWVIPYGLAVIIFTGVYIRFLLQLPKRIMILFIISGATFISGAIGMEIFGSLYADQYGRDSLGWAVLYTLEELLEMLGIAIFIYTLLSYINNQFGDMTIVIKEKI